MWPEALIERLVTTLSAPGERVALLTRGDPATDAPGPVYGTAARVLVPPGTLAAAAETVDAHGRCPHLAGWTANDPATATPYWARFVNPAPVAGEDLPVPAGEAEPVPATPPERSVPNEAIGTARLVIAAVDPGGVSDSFGAAAAALLRPGGTLAAITHCEHRQGRLVDPSGAIVAAAQNADLLYLQHVVALHHPISGGRIADATGPAPTACGPAPRRRHTRVHRDLYLFFKCADPAAAGSAW